MERTSSHSSVEGAQSADQPPDVVGDVWSQAGDKGDSGDTSVDGESLEVLSNLANTVQSVYETLQVGHESRPSVIYNLYINTLSQGAV